MYVDVVKQRQRQVPGIQTVQFVDVPQVHFIDKVVDVRVVKNVPVFATVCVRTCAVFMLQSSDLFQTRWCRHVAVAL